VSIAAAHDALNEAVAARDAARDRVVKEIDRQFAATIVRLHQELSEARARQQERESA
jgi:hypothetical protein